MQTVLVFPGPNAVSLQQFVLQNASEAQTSEVTAANDSGSTRGAVLNTVVFIDSTWYQVYKIATDPRLTSKIHRYLECPKRVIGFELPTILVAHTALPIVCKIRGVTGTHKELGAKSSQCRH